MFLFVYVDDIIVIGKNDQTINKIIETLGGEFPMHDLGELGFITGIQVWRTIVGLHLSQTQNLMYLLNNIDMGNLHPTVTSMVTNLEVHSNEEIIKEVREYRQVLGCLYT